MCHEIIRLQKMDTINMPHGIFKNPATYHDLNPSKMDYGNFSRLNKNKFEI